MKKKHSRKNSVVNSGKFAALSSASAVIALTMATRATFADTGISYTTGTTYTQNFDSLNTLGNTPPANLELNGTVIQIGPAVVGSSDIDLTGPSTDPAQTIPSLSNMTGWWADSFTGNSLPLNYNVSDGTSNTQALTAFFDPAKNINAGVGNTTNNMALGVISGTNTGAVVFGVELINNGNTTLNSFSLSYTGQLFHQDSNQQALAFGYAITSANASIPTSGTNGISTMNVGGFATGLSGAVSGVTSNYSITSFPLATAWLPGQALWLTWSVGQGGGGQGLGIDDLSFSANNVPTNATLTWAGGNGTWDNATAQWNNGNTTGQFFFNGDNVIFPNAASNTTIAVSASNITLQSSANITNNSNTTYTFTGGSIGGAAASLNITGNGTVKLTAPNTYGIGTNVLAGKLTIDNNNELGAATALLTLNGGTLQLAGNVDATNRPLSVGANGAIINTNGSNITFAGAGTGTVGIHGLLEITGGGNVNIGQVDTFGTATAPIGGLQIDAGSTVTWTGLNRTGATNIFSNTIINGKLVLNTNGNATTGGARINFNSPTGALVNGIKVGNNGTSKITGSGEIDVLTGSKYFDVITGNGTINNWQFDNGGVIISNASGDYAAEVDVNIVLNPLSITDPTNHPFQRLDITQANFIAPNNTLPTNAFGTVIGGTKSTNPGHGPGFANLVFNGVISGNSDVSIGNDYAAGGSGDTTFNNQMTYNGATLINGGSQANVVAGLPGPALVVGVTDALPTNTDVVFAAFLGSAGGVLDLNGHDQHVASISCQIASNSPQANVIDNAGTSNATLFITGNNTPLFPYGASIDDGGQNSVTGVVGNATLALSKSGSSTLVLGYYLNSTTTSNSTYSGGTTVSGGTLQIGFDGALGAPQGNLTMDGGTLSIQNPFFIGDINGFETSVSFNSDRPFAVTANGGTITNPSFTASLQTGGSDTQSESVTFSGAGGYKWASTPAHPLTITNSSTSYVAFNGTTSNVSVTPGATILVASAGKLVLGGTTDPLTDTSNGTRHVAIVNNSAVALNFTADVTVGSNISGNGNLTKFGVSNVTLTGNYTATGNITISNGTLAFANTSNTRQDTGVVLKMSSLSIAPTSTLDITNHDLIIGNSSLTTVQTEILNGFGAGPGGAAITSSTALNGAPTFLVPLDATAFGITSWDNVPVDQPNSIVVKYTTFGDANIDGLVNADDFSVIISNLGTTTPGTADITTSILEGDVNLDGLVNADDFSVVITNLGSAPLFASPTNSSSVASPSAAVPEPASLFLLGLGSACVLVKRKRLTM